MSQLKFFAQRTPLAGEIALYAAQDGDDGRRGVVQNLTLEWRERGEMARPFVHLDYDSAQQLMDELWNCGLRPSEGSGSAGALAATQRHLDDMRKLVFKGDIDGR